MSASAWKPHPCFVCVCMHKIRSFTGLPRATPIDRLIAVAGTRSATLAVCQLQMGLLLCKAREVDLCTTPTFSKHVLVPVNLLGPHTMLCTTPTNPSLYLLVITGICIATYLQYTYNTNSNVRLGFSNPGHIQVKSGSPGHPGQQL